jgi:hypothetical protein
MMDLLVVCRYSAAGRNCAASVDPLIAVVDDCPPVMAIETASK